MIRRRYSKARELTKEECIEAYNAVRKKYKQMGVDLPDLEAEQFLKKHFPQKEFMKTK